jgi:hypothetical protein
MATREDQPKPLVRDLLDVVSQALERAQLRSFLGFDRSDAFPSQAIDRLIAGSEDDPSCRVVRNAPCRPGTQSLDECVLDRLLSEVEAARRSDQGRDRPSRLAAEQEVEVFTGLGRWYQPCGWSGNSWIGRSSTVPYMAPGQRVPASIASSRLLTSSR